MEADILLIDDGKEILDLMEEALLKEGFHHTRKACNGADALHIYRGLHPHVIVLDIMLPDTNGLEVRKRTREFSYCSTLLLSPRNDDIDKMLELSRGGDDYATEPFSSREMVFHIKAQLHRQQYQTPSPSGYDARLAIGPLTIDKESCRAQKNGREVESTGREFLLLAYPTKHGDRIISKKRFYKQV